MDERSLFRGTTDAERREELRVFFALRRLRKITREMNSTILAGVREAERQREQRGEAPRA